MLADRLPLPARPRGRPFVLTLACAGLMIVSVMAGGNARAQTPPAGASPQTADYIVAVINQESVTAVEVEQRLRRVKDEAARTREALPSDAELKRQLLDGLIEERAMLSLARGSGLRIEEIEIDRAVANIAAQNRATVGQLREQLVREGTDYKRFRASIKDQMLVERVREREVLARIRITDTEVDAEVDKLRGNAAGDLEYNIAQVLVPVAEDASPAQLSERRKRAETALAEARGGRDFAAVVRTYSEGPNRDREGEIGLRTADRLPDLFLEAVRPLTPGQVAPGLVRSGAGFHVLKLVERRDASAVRVRQTRSRHILLRVLDPTRREAAVRQMEELRSLITRGAQTFESVARERSEDSSSVQGGDLGWANPGVFVPEFEQAMDALPVGGLSGPVVSRYGVHLIQVLDRRENAIDRKQLREQARALLRERKFEETFREWSKEARSRAYVELRDAPER